MFRLALRNIFRHQMRSLMVIAAIATGVMALLIVEGFIRDVYHQFGEDLIHSQLGHVQVARKNYFENGFRTPQSFLLEKSDETRKKITAIPGVKHVMPRLDFSAMLSNGSAEIAIIGEAVDVAQDAVLSGGLKMINGQRLPPGKPQSAFVGKGVADSLRLKPGDIVTLSSPTVDGAINTTELEICGVFASASKDYDDRAIRIALPVAQSLLGTNQLSRFVVLADDRANADGVASALRVSLPAAQFDVRTWVELSDVYRNTVTAYEGQFGVIRLILLLLVILSVSNVVNMSIFERTGEYGTMRALGNDGAHVAKMIYIETALLGAVGALVGVLLGAIAALVISKIGIPMPPPPNVYLGYLAQIRVDTGMLLRAFVIGLIVPLPACIWPAYKMRKIAIIDALRHNI
jgi:putative ABC transport system permease protein